MSRRSLCLTCALGVAFTIAGAGVMMASLSNDRDERVSAYVESMRFWEASSRSLFASSTFSVNATVVGGASAGPLALLLLTATETDDPDFRLVLGGINVEDRAPLRFLGSLDFPPYTRGNATAAADQDGSWQLLPGKGDAATATFDFRATDGNGTAAFLELSGVPLVYDEVVPPLMPSPKNKCLALQRGIWQGAACHRVQRLTRVCVQVVPDSTGAGGWVLRRRPGAAEGSGDVMGCDPSYDWSPATYQVDACWGAAPSDSCPDSLTAAQTVEVTIRSFEDPVIRAAELTNNRFDFGLNASTERILAIALLATGLLLFGPPIIQTCRLCRGGRGGKDSGEEMSPCPSHVGRARWGEY